MRRVLRLIALAFATLVTPCAPAQQPPDVPYVPTPWNVVEAMLEIGRVNGSDFLIDLGSGDGRIVIEAAKKNGTRGMGIELDPNLVSIATAEAKRQGVTRKVAFVQGNVFYTDFSKASVLTMYLLPQINLQLRSRVFGELRPGTRVVSHDFDMGNWKPDLKREIAVPNKSYGPPSSVIYLWYVPADVSGKWQWRLTVGGTARLYEATVEQAFQELRGAALVDGGTASGFDATLRGDLIALTLEREFFGRKVRHEFSGRVAGDQAIGRAKVTSAEGEQTLDWQATRVARGKMHIE